MWTLNSRILVVGTATRSEVLLALATDKEGFEPGSLNPGSWWSVSDGSPTINPKP